MVCWTQTPCASQSLLIASFSFSWLVFHPHLNFQVCIKCHTSSLTSTGLGDALWKCRGLAFCSVKYKQRAIKIGEYEADELLPHFSLLRIALKYGFPCKLPGEILWAEQHTWQLISCVSLQLKLLVTR